MNIKNFFSKNWIHFAFLAVFIIITVAYFSPQFDGFGLKQHDIEQFKGMSNEIVHYREETGKEPLWTNSMFGGMPATQISVQYGGNVFKAVYKAFFSIFSPPAGFFLLHLICFYILALFLRIKPIIAVVGAFAFAFASYEIIIMQAGHNSKALAVAVSPAVLGAFIYAFQRSWKWGAVASAIFMGFELAANHLQVTYYLAILLFFLGLYFLVKAIKEKELKKFGFASGGVILGYGLALLVNYGNIQMTNDYAKDTIRGGNDITIGIDGSTSSITTSGLDKDYITQWSYGIGESFTLISPYVKGSHSAALGNTHLADIADKTDLSPSTLKQVRDLPVYWGEQPITSGPVYLGVLVVFLALLGLVFLKGKMKWILFGVALLALMLSWGKNFMGLTDFFIDHVPGYNKFRTVTIIMVLIELCLPVIAILLLQKFYDEREEIKAKKKLFLYASGAFFVFLLAVKFIGLGDGYTSSGDQAMIDRYRNGMMDQIADIDPAVLQQQYGIDVNNSQQVDEFINAQMDPIERNFADLRIVRAEIFSTSMTRTLVIAFFAILIVSLFFFSKLPSPYIIGGLVILTLADLIPVNLNYLSSEEDARGNYLFWTPKSEQEYPISALPADVEIMNNELAENPALSKAIAKAESKGKKKVEELGYTSTAKRRLIDSYKFAALNSETNYRVFDMNGGWGSSRASYFHKSLGGYHGAKLRNIQNLFEFHISRSNNNVLNMLNVKYFIQGDKVNRNAGALGNAWLVKSVRECENPNEEMRALGKKYALNNVGSGQLIVNDDKVKTADVFGGEYLKYVLASGDSLDVPLSNGLTKGIKAYFVMDARGTVNLVPEMTILADTANSFVKMVTIEVMSDFAPAEEAVMLKSEAAKLAKKKFTAEGSVKMTAYAPNEIDYEVNATGDQLIVFSEIYYKKGWKAFVDGKGQDILKVDYLLRGLEVKGGKHKIAFIFDLPAYHTASKMAYGGSVVLLLIIVMLCWGEVRKPKANLEKEH